jgi:hypothetical protein
MVQKPEIRNWHREAFLAGEKDKLPEHVIKLLEAEKKEAKKEVKKDKAE